MCRLGAPGRKRGALVTARFALSIEEHPDAGRIYTECCTLYKKCVYTVDPYIERYLSDSESEMGNGQI